MVEKQRSTTPHSLEIYSFKNYIAYTLYPPLYIAGPIITFNNFLWQVRTTIPKMERIYSLFVDTKADIYAAGINPQISYQVPDMRSHHGVHPALHVRCRHQGHSGVGRSQRCGIESNRFLELDYRLAKGTVSILSFETR